MLTGFSSRPCTDLGSTSKKIKWLHRAAIKSTLDPNKPGGNPSMGNHTTGTHSIHTSS